jgi:hypothetical protein
MRRFEVLVILAATLMVGCENRLPMVFRTEEAPVYVKIGANYLAIPQNHLDSPIENDGRDGRFTIDHDLLMGFVWPTMEGKTKKNFSTDVSVYGGKDNYMGVLIGASSWTDERLQIGFDGTYRLYISEKGTLKKVGTEYGFTHYVRTNTRQARQSDGPTSDIYERYRADGSRQAFMDCDHPEGFPAAEPLCDLWVIYPEFPDLVLNIGQRRDQMLPNINGFEKAIVAKLLAFRMAGEAARKADGDR